VSGNFTTWRWLILIGCLAPAYWAAEGIARLFELAVEWRFFEDRRVLYYLIGTTVSALKACRCKLVHQHDSCSCKQVAKRPAI